MFVASGLNINGCVLSYFEGTANLHCYTSCTLTTLHCSKVSFLQCFHMKRYNKILQKMWWGVLTSVRNCNIYIYKHKFTGHFIRYTLLVPGWTLFCLQNCLRPVRLASATIPRSKSLKSLFLPILMLGFNNLCYQAIEQVYLIKWPVCVCVRACMHARVCVYIYIYIIMHIILRYLVVLYWKLRAKQKSVRCI